jgi:hypothetical protein
MRIDEDYMKFYKIRNTKTNLFSTGGVNPYWSKLGKVWTTKAHIKSHLELFKDYDNRYFFPDSYKYAEIVELETIELQSIPLLDEFMKKEQ